MWTLTLTLSTRTVYDGVEGSREVKVIKIVEDVGRVAAVLFCILQQSGTVFLGLLVVSDILGFFN